MLRAQPLTLALPRQQRSVLTVHTVNTLPRTQELGTFFLGRVKHLYGEQVLEDEEGFADKWESVAKIVKGMSRKGGKGGRPKAGHGIKWAPVRAKMLAAQEQGAGGEGGAADSEGDGA